MELTLYIVILVLGILTYGSAVVQMLSNDYSPSLFSRGIWLLLGINSFAGVALGGGSPSSQLLAATLVIGSGAVFIASMFKGSREFGLVEHISLYLFLASCILWILVDAPFINLILSLVAHFIGGIPTIWRTIKRPQSEKALHWYFFFAASVLTIINSSEKSLRTILFPVYFICFDGLIILLVNRGLLSEAKTKWQS